MITEQSIEVDAPAATVYERWRFEEFPRFMDGVGKVERLGGKQLRWVSEMCGKRVEWSAEITDEVPCQRIAWQSRGGHFNSGTVSFTSLGPMRTRIDLRVEYEPKDIARVLEPELEIEPAQLRDDLECFRQLIEESSAK